MREYSRWSVTRHLSRLQVCGGERCPGPQRGHLAGGHREADQTEDEDGEKQD